MDKWDDRFMQMAQVISPKCNKGVRNLRYSTWYQCYKTKRPELDLLGPLFQLQQINLVVLHRGDYCCGLMSARQRTMNASAARANTLMEMHTSGRVGI